MEDVGNGGELIWLGRLCAWTSIEFKIILKKKRKREEERKWDRRSRVYISVKTCMYTCVKYIMIWILFMGSRGECKRAIQIFFLKINKTTKLQDRWTIAGLLQ